MTVVILGLGRLGGSLAMLLPRAGITIRTWRRGMAVPDGDVGWVCVRDGAIAEVAALCPPSMPLLHASGALRADALGPRAERGVLHPLMTFPGPEVRLPSLAGVTARVEGTPTALGWAETISRALGMVPLRFEGDVRAYHAAAVLASNHVAGVFAEASAVLAAAGVPPAQARAMLARLAHESIDRVVEVGPTAITGPAARGDITTMDGHRVVLPPDARAAYDAVAARIPLLRRDG